MSTKKKKFLISTAIDYPSAMPHIGHALEKVQADVIARYKRLQGYEVHFSVGTDEHGLKIERYAKKVGKSPKEFVNKMSRDFKNLCKILDISNNDFIRTTEKRHIETVQKVFQKIHKKGDIYQGKYKGLYCVDCESFYLLKDLENGKCPIHKKPTELIEEETYFFRTSKYQNQIIKHIKDNKNFIVPQKRTNEILARLKEPLQDLSIARKTVEWGIPFFLDKNFTTYCWAEALLNYITTIDYPNEKFKKFWPGEIYIGKDILWHHSVIFSSLLLSAGLKLPKTIFVHGFITVGGQKMSKSLGNVVAPFELVEKYGTDAVRYYLLREISTTEDGDFTIEKFEVRYNADLAKGLGNLTARVITLTAKNPPARSRYSVSGGKVNKEIKKIQKNYKQEMDEFKLNSALEEIWKLIGFCDRYIEKEKPWEQKDNQLSVINDLLIALSNIAEMLAPFLPETSEKILKQIKSKSKGKPLFPRI